MKTEATKDLAYFQQQVAKKYKFEDWKDLFLEYALRKQPERLLEYANEAAEAYAAYRFEQCEIKWVKKARVFADEAFEEGKKRGYAEGFEEGFEQGKQAGAKEFINALTERTANKTISYSKQYLLSILNGLKQEED